MADFYDGPIDPGCFQVKRRGLGYELGGSTSRNRLLKASSRRWTGWTRAPLHHPGWAVRRRGTGHR
jgi:hypothetical protein